MQRSRSPTKSLVRRRRRIQASARHLPSQKPETNISHPRVVGKMSFLFLFFGDHSLANLSKFIFQTLKFILNTFYDLCVFHFCLHRHHFVIQYSLLFRKDESVSRSQAAHIGGKERFTKLTTWQVQHTVKMLQELWQTHKLISIIYYTLQEINISHLGKRKIIFKMDFSGDMLVPWRVYITYQVL